MSGRGPLFTEFQAVFDEEQIREHRQRDMVMPAPPRTALEVVEAKFVLEFAVRMLNPPPSFGESNQLTS